MSSKAAKTYRAPALAKGLEILELLAGVDEPLAQAEIARRSGRSVNELFRMLSELESLGYVIRDDLGAYSLTLKLFSLANPGRCLSRFLQLAAGPMREYSHRSGEECHLCTLEDGQLVVLANYNGHQPISLSVRAGSVHHPMRTASGRLLLAQLPDEEQRWHLKRAKEHFGDKKMTLSGAQKILAELVGGLNLQARDESLAGLTDHVHRIESDSLPLHVTVASSWFYSGKNATDEAAIIEALKQTAEQLRGLM